MTLLIFFIASIALGGVIRISLKGDRLRGALVPEPWVSFLSFGATVLCIALIWIGLHLAGRI